VCWLEHGLVHVADSGGTSPLAPDGARPCWPARDRWPTRTRTATTSYPFAAVRLHSLFADPEGPTSPWCTPARTTGPSAGGHRGEHGSLNALQSRAAAAAAGPGVTARGTVDGVARTVDVRRHLAHLTGGSYDDMDGSAGLPRQSPARRTRRAAVGRRAERRPAGPWPADGTLPSVARLLARGCALRGGAIAEFPSVTLVNHTCALTGVGPGRHGIVNNAYFDRSTGEQVVPNSAALWHSATELLRPGVRTLFERLPAGATSACVNEPVDRGADYSTFALVREAGRADGGSLSDWLPPAAADPHATQQHVAAHADYAWATQVDGIGLTQVLDLWRDGEPPSLTWWNTTLTDSGHHAGGPASPIATASLADADRRLAVWLDLLDERGLTDSVTVLLTADHGMQGADPACTGDWDEALTAAGVPFRDEAYGFIYLG
jgi:hypothetical protein